MLLSRWLYATGQTMSIQCDKKWVQKQQVKVSQLKHQIKYQGLGPKTKPEVDTHKKEYDYEQSGHHRLLLILPDGSLSFITQNRGWLSSPPKPLTGYFWFCWIWIGRADLPVYSQWWQWNTPAQIKSRGGKKRWNNGCLKEVLLSIYRNKRRAMCHLCQLRVHSLCMTSQWY